MAIKCESPLSPQSRRLRIKRPYDDNFGNFGEYQKYGNEENEDFRRFHQRPYTKDLHFNKDHLRVLRNQYYFSHRWRNVPFRSIGDRNGNLLMIAPVNKEDEKDHDKDKDGKGGGGGK